MVAPHKPQVQTLCSQSKDWLHKAWIGPTCIPYCIAPQPSAEILHCLGHPCLNTTTALKEETTINLRPRTLTHAQLT